MRLLAQHRNHRDTWEDRYHVEDEDDDDKGKGEKHIDTDNEDLEFTVTEDMLNFFETSERHKREMRRKYGFRTAREDENPEETPFVSAAESARVRKEEAALLYGNAGSKILAMETALQSMVERYEDTTNPQYWPNIPLKL